MSSFRKELEVCTLSETQLVVFYFALAILSISASIGGKLAQHFKSPVIVGELAAGIMLGPSVFGQLFPQIQTALFPISGINYQALWGISTFGIVAFLLLAGLEINLEQAWHQLPRAVPIAAAGIAIPFAAAFIAAYFFPDVLGCPASTPKEIFALFIGAALSITALSTTAKSLFDLNLFKTQFGTLVMLSAVIDDSIASILIGAVFALHNLQYTGSVRSGKICMMFAGTLLFVGIMLTAGRVCCKQLMRLFNHFDMQPYAIAGFILGLGMAGASLTQAMGVNSLLGAFIVGVVIASSDFPEEARQFLKDFVTSFLAPLFFAVLGLKLNFAAGNFSWTIVICILLLACISKAVACFLAGRWQGMTATKSWAIAAALNGRGGLGMIVAVTGLQAQIIDERVFLALAVMSIVTIIISGGVLGSFAPGLHDDDIQLPPELSKQDCPPDQCH
jgi:Kef-type K+ transport system membrane component KefB